MFRSGKLPLNSRQCTGTRLGNNLVMDDCDPLMDRLRRLDSSIDRAKQRKKNEERRKKEKRKRTWYSKNHSNFSSALRPAEAQGNNKRLLQPLFLLLGYREVKPSKNSVCVCVGVCVCMRTCVYVLVCLHVCVCVGMCMLTSTGRLHNESH